MSTVVRTSQDSRDRPTFQASDPRIRSHLVRFLATTLKDDDMGQKHGQRSLQR